MHNSYEASNAEPVRRAPKNLAFCIPIMHPDTARSWTSLVSQLEGTVNSLINADDGTTGIFIGCNVGSTLPDFGTAVHVDYLDLPKPPLSKFGHFHEIPKEVVEERRLDKGLKRLAALHSAKEQGFKYVMMVDADDLISAHIPSFVSKNLGSPGWFINQGYIHKQKSRWLHLKNQFHCLCGTSIIVRSSLLDAPFDHTDRSINYVKKILGSHIYLPDYMKSNGYNLQPLPFPGAVYEVGHENNISNTYGVKLTFSATKPLSSLRTLYWRIRNTRRITRNMYSEFMLIN